MVSNELMQVKDFLARRNAPPGCEVALIEDGSAVVYVPSDKVAEKAGEGMTSRRQLRSWEKRAKDELGFPVAFRVTMGKQQQGLETALMEFFQANYEEIVTGVDVRYRLGDLVDVTLWGDPTRADAAKNVFLTRIRSFLESLNKTLGTLDWENVEGQEPTAIAILRATKVAAPARLGDIALRLRNAGFSIRSSKWLGSQLDLLRKKGLVLYVDNGQYAPTAQALSLIPHGITADSSDVDRALALGRRKWT